VKECGNASDAEALRLELERCQRKLEEAHRRVGQLEQAEALQAGENRVLEMIAKGNSLPAILDALCRLVEEVSTGPLCSILLLDGDGKRLRHGAAPSLSKRYTE